MRAMVLETIGGPLRLVDRPVPTAGPGELVLRVLACAICRTDLHILRGEVAAPRLPLVLGHQVIGTVVESGPATSRFAVGARVGVAWLAHTCGVCPFCRSGRENLCDLGRFTGFDRDGGFAEATVVSESYCYPVPRELEATRAAPLLCGGAIGFRALSMAGEAHRLGLYGFGASAHILAQVARHQGRQVFAFTRPGDLDAQQLARQLGAFWVGDSTVQPPVPLEAAILFAPVGALVPQALASVDKGGVVVCAGIHMSDLPPFPYRLLWGERVLRSVANVCRADVERFLALAATVPLELSLHVFPLEEANEALAALEQGRLTGTAVLQVATD